MREMIQVAAWFASVTLIGLGAIGLADTLLGIRHVNADGTAVAPFIVVLHYAPSVLFGAALTSLWYRIFRS
jgi:hypothetical protein